MEKYELLRILTGVENPRNIKEREDFIIDECLKIINKREREIMDLKLLNSHYEVELSFLKTKIH